MQPVAVTIEGSFYDSLLVGDRFFLFSSTGRATVHSWRALVGRLKTQCTDPLVENLLLPSATRLLRSQMDSLLLQDSKLRTAIKERLQEMSAKQLTITTDDLTATLIKSQQVPFDFPFASFEIFNGLAFVAGSFGVEELSARNSLNDIFYKKNSKRRFSAPCTQARLGWDVILACAGGAGLWQLDLRDGGEKEQVSDKFITSCGWLGTSVYATSPIRGEGELLIYEFPDRKFIERISEKQLLGDVEQSWGDCNRICGFRGSQLLVSDVRFIFGVSGPAVESPREVDLPIHGEFVSAGNAAFGTVIETDSELIVVDSELTVAAVPGVVTNWRIYPRSRQYGGFMSVASEGYLTQLVFPDNLLPKSPVDVTKAVRKAPKNLRLRRVA